MKKKIVALLGVFTLTAACLAGCGSAGEQTPASEPAVTEEPAAPEEPAAEPEETGEEEESMVGMANPWVEITEEEANEICPRLFKAPDGAASVEWTKCEELGDPENNLGALVQLNYELDGLYYNARAQYGAAEDADISGCYVEWTVGPEDVSFSNWGDGNMKGQMYRSINDTGYVDLITWYDIEIGIKYSLSVSAEDLDGFDISAVADAMYSGDNEPFADMPSNFIEERSGKTEFADYDEVISCLTEGQGYAYINLYGYEGDVLAVTDLVFEYDHSAPSASIFMMEDGAARYVGDVQGNGSAYPLRLEDGIIYAGDNHNYYTHFAASSYTGIMVKDVVCDDIANDGAGFTGTLREDNNYDNDVEFTGGQEEFEKLLAEREEKPIIEFTMI